ncbi:MAG: PSD1 and planctomycete cytochrome C domain-containing protein, partial [Planctomyces sp.]
MHSSVSTSGLALVAWLLVTAGHAAAQTAESPVDLFERTIRPLLLDRCIECHGPTKQEHQVRLDRRSDVLSGSASDIPLIVPGQPGKSRLWQVLQHAEDDIRMPSSGKLDQPALDAVQSWILQGAPWPETADLEADATARLQRWRQHWAFQPVRAPDLSTQPPNIQTIDWLIDRQLQPHGLQRSPAAPAAVITRRLAYAITGLPPELTDLAAARNAEQTGTLSAWLSDYTERLLAQPQYGERWGRYWLDVARYADTKGYVFTENREYADAWRYREWVIRSLNNDQPFDQFIHQQLAADRLPGADDPAQLAAMGFLTLGRRFLNNTHDIIDDRIDLVTRGLMGVTVSCARCHDHKYDPISQADYYSLYGVFASSEEPGGEPSPLRLVDRPQPVEPVIFVRGSPGNRGPAVPRRFPVALSAPDAPAWQTGSGRLELAQAITSPANPLTARVAVNRIWMHLFGQGLVQTPGDFGVRTEKPQHAEMLDWLSAEFMASGWSRKPLLRTILRSETRRQSSDRRPDAEP